MVSQNIFLGEDIRKQLPNESALFDQVNNNWKAIMDRMNKDNNALRSTHYPGKSSAGLRWLYAFEDHGLLCIITKSDNVITITLNTLVTVSSDSTTT
jgi:hypothetical protein